MLLAADGEALFANAAMQTLAKQNDGLVLDRNGRPLIIHMEARRRFDTLLTNVSAGGAGGIVAAPRTGGRDYIVLVAPSPASAVQSDWERNGQRGAIVVVHDPDSGSANTSEILEPGAWTVERRGAAGRRLGGRSRSQDVCRKRRRHNPHRPLPFAEARYRGPEQRLRRRWCGSPSACCGFRTGRTQPGITNVVMRPCKEKGRPNGAAFAFVCPAETISANRIR